LSRAFAFEELVQLLPKKTSEGIQSAQQALVFRLARTKLDRIQHIVAEISAKALAVERDVIGAPNFNTRHAAANLVEKVNRPCVRQIQESKIRCMVLQS
jgi:hypothetical protein